jgi:DNA-binding CsgD family transcriptional regulator
MVNCEYCGKPHITPKELELVNLVVSGVEGTKAIAQATGGNEQTIKNQFGELNIKLGVHSTTQLIIKLIRLGIVKV